MTAESSIVEEYIPEHKPDLEAKGIELTVCLRCKRLGYDLRSLERHNTDERGFFTIRYLHPKGEIIQRDQNGQIIRRRNVEEEIHAVGQAIGMDRAFNIPAEVVGRSALATVVPQQQQVVPTATPIIKEEIYRGKNLNRRTTNELLDLQIRVSNILKQRFKEETESESKPESESKSKPKSKYQHKNANLSMREIIKCPIHGVDAREYYDSRDGINWVHVDAKTHNERCRPTDPNQEPLSSNTMQLYLARFNKAKPDAKRRKELEQELDNLKQDLINKYPKEVKCYTCVKPAKWIPTTNNSRKYASQYIANKGKIPPLYIEFIHDDNSRHLKGMRNRSIPELFSK